LGAAGDVVELSPARIAATIEPFQDALRAINYCI